MNRRTLLLVGTLVASLATIAIAVAVGTGSKTPTSTPPAPAPVTPATTDGGDSSGSAGGGDGSGGGSSAGEGVVATVDRTCGADGGSDCFVTLRSAPTGRSSDRGQLDEGAKIRVVCQRHGQRAYSSVLGRSSDIWARTSDGLYLANVYLSGGGLTPSRITLGAC